MSREGGSITVRLQEVCGPRRKNQGPYRGERQVGRDCAWSRVQQEEGVWSG